LLSRGLTIVFGLLQIAIGIAAVNLSTRVVENALAIAGFSAGLLLGLFALGILTPSVRQRAALGGLVAGLVTMLVLKFVVPMIDERWTIAWPWYPVVGSVTTFFAALLLGPFASRAES
jgi:Na+/proline symporter